VPDEPLESIRGRPALAFCGIGNPEGFRRTLEGLGVEVRNFRTFPDHHIYSAGDVGELARWAEASGVEFALTTQKDLVKLRAAMLGLVPLRAVRIGLEPIEGEDALVEALARAVPDAG
jgi:tetraacyldisaccharide 4'-kinase